MITYDVVCIGAGPTGLATAIEAKRAGMALDPATRKPRLNPETLESNVPGLYLAGVVIGGTQTSEIFIENGRFHGKQIVQAMK